MIDREQAIEAAWRLFTASMPASEVREVEARLVDGTWAVLFSKHESPDCVESPGCRIIDVSPSGQAEWFEVL